METRVFQELKDPKELGVEEVMLAHQVPWEIQETKGHQDLWVPRDQWAPF